MKHYGDICKLHGAELPVVDIITGGSPCQDLSVAGKRAGLAGERSGLFMEQIRVIKEMRDHDRANGRTNEHIRPRYMVWENVPGAFSSNHGEDFRAVLEETAKVAEGDASIPGFEGGRWPSAGCIMGDGWSIAWRVHDAQFWGVPQRRKRIALIADFGGSTAPEILFEREGVSGDFEESGTPRERAAGDAERGVRKTVAVLNDQGGSVMGISENVTGSLRAQEHGHQPIVYGISAYDSNAMKSANPHSGVYEAETARTLDLNGGSPACNQGGMAVVCLEGNGSRPSHQGDGYVESETMYTLNSTEYHAVAYRKQSHPKSAEQGQGWEQTEINDTLNAFDSGECRTPTVVLENHPADSRVKISKDGIVQTLSSRMGTGGCNVPMVMEPVCIGNGQAHIASHLTEGVSQTLNCMHDPMAVMTYQDRTGTVDACIGKGTSNQLANNDMFVANTSVVRRLTPLECERLQGYPDGWTDIGDWADSKGKTHKGDSDSPRYKALGNSIALPYWSWMAGRMVKYIDHKPTMASLFDGIGGFPLVFSRAGCVPVWASEIEEFPIAVTKLHFPEDEDENIT